jgi:hypothetical protein
MNMNVNFMVKVEDAKVVDVQKALEQAGIKVRSVLEVHKDKAAEAEKEASAEAPGGGNN